MSKKRIALLLSGGGFRAMLYHLGVIKYLRSCDLLQNVSAICAVSGGAIIGAHVAHNWARYNSGDESFAEAAHELLALARTDMRGRIVRRMPLAGLWTIFFGAFLGRFFPRLRIGRSSLLRNELREFFGKGSEFLIQAATDSETHTTPKLYILATNLTTGRASSFSQAEFSQDDPENALVMTTEALRTADAVAASTSFPAFFPPLEIVASDIGVGQQEFQFPKQYLTDGGVYDNLGIRKLRQLKEQGDKFHLAVISDGGAAFEPDPGKRFYSLFRTAVRAVDILFQRVENLELELLKHTTTGAKNADSQELLGTSLITIKISDEVNNDRLLPSHMQLDLCKIRTDLDRFTSTECRWLIRLGFSKARQAIENKAKLLGKLNLATTNVPPDDPCSDLFTDKELSVTPQEIDRDWEIVKRGSRRKWRVFDISDRFSYFNIGAVFLFVFIIVAIPLNYYKSIVTDGRFFTDAYPNRASFVLTYGGDIVKEWGESLRKSKKEDKLRKYSVLKKYIDDENLELPDESTLSKEEEGWFSELRGWNRSKGNEGTGEAFFSVVDEKKDLDTSKFVDAAMEENRWVGIIYYQFPKDDRVLGLDSFDSLFEPDTYYRLYDQIFGKFERDYAIMHFRSKGVKKNGGGTQEKTEEKKKSKNKPMCLSFLQRPDSVHKRREYDVSFEPGDHEASGSLMFPQIEVFSGCEDSDEGTMFKVGKMKFHYGKP